MSVELEKELREYYTAEPIPPCCVCGKALTVQSAGGGRATEYACAGEPGDKDWLDHYNKSRFEHRRPGDNRVITLLDAIATERVARGVAERERDDACRMYLDGSTLKRALAAEAHTEKEKDVIGRHARLIFILVANIQFELERLGPKAEIVAVHNIGYWISKILEAVAALSPSPATRTDCAQLQPHELKSAVNEK